MKKLPKNKKIKTRSSTTWATEKNSEKNLLAKVKFSLNHFVISRIFFLKDIFRNAIELFEIQGIYLLNNIKFSLYNHLKPRNIINFLYSNWKYPIITIGGIQQVRGQNFPIFWPPHPCMDSFFTLSVDKNRHFWPPPPHLVHVVIECPFIK